MQQKKYCGPYFFDSYKNMVLIKYHLVFCNFDWKSETSMINQNVIHAEIVIIFPQVPERAASGSSTLWWATSSSPVSTTLPSARWKLKWQFKKKARLFSRQKMV